MKWLIAFLLICSLSAFGANPSFSTSSVTYTRVNTNSVILAGSGLSTVNTTWTWNGSTKYTNATAALGLFFNTGDQLWEITNNLGIIYYASPSVSVADQAAFPFVWTDAGVSPPGPTGIFALGTTNVSLSYLNPSGLYLFSNGVAGSYLNIGSNNSVTVEHLDNPSSVIGGFNNAELGFNSLILGGSANTNYGVGSFIGGSANTLIRGSGGDQAMIASENSYLNNDAGVATLISCFNCTNTGHSFNAMISCVGSTIPAGAEAVAIIGAQNCLHSGSTGFSGGYGSTNYGDYLLSWGRDNFVTNTSDSIVLGEHLRLTNANPAIQLGYYSNHVTISTNGNVQARGVVSMPSLSVSGSGGISLQTNSTAPNNTTTIRVWVSVTNNGVVFKMPLYQ